VFVVAALCSSDPSAAQSYPNRTVRLIVPFGAGSLSDIMGRILADGLTKLWGQQVIVENRAGVPGTLAVAQVVPDGYTLMVTSNGHTALTLTNKNLPFDPIKDFAPITRISSLPLYLVVNPELQAKTVAELSALAKASPGKLNFASPGLASTAFIAGALFRNMTKLDIVHVPYRSAPDSVTSVLRGDAHMYFAPVNLTAELAQSGKVRAIAAATAERIAELPNVPTFREAGLDFVYDSWFGLMAPAALPRELIEKLHRDTLTVLQTPEIQARMASQAAVVAYDKAPEKFAEIVKADTARLADILKDMQ
jgi:tripartite-type tricarboxylate transporter receptor subunit TctC